MYVDIREVFRTFPYMSYNYEIELVTLIPTKINVIIRKDIKGKKYGVYTYTTLLLFNKFFVTGTIPILKHFVVTEHLYIMFGMYVKNLNDHRYNIFKKFSILKL